MIRLVVMLASSFLTLTCNTIINLSADCPTDDGMSITPDQDLYDIGDELTCSADDDAYDPTHSWTGSASLDPAVSSPLNPYPLVEGPFQLTCTAAVTEVPCSATKEIAGIGKCRKRHTIVVTVFMTK